MNLTLSALGPSIAEQCEAGGVEATGLPMEMIERIHRALTLAHIHGMLTDAEIDRARNRLIKAAKFKAAP